MGGGAVSPSGGTKNCYQIPFRTVKEGKKSLILEKHWKKLKIILISSNGHKYIEFAP